MNVKELDGKLALALAEKEETAKVNKEGKWQQWHGERSLGACVSPAPLESRPESIETTDFMS